MGYWESLIAVHVAARLTAYADAQDLGAVSGADSTMRMASDRVQLPNVALRGVRVTGEAAPDARARADSCAGPVGVSPE